MKGIVIKSLFVGAFTAGGVYYLLNPSWQSTLGMFIGVTLGTATYDIFKRVFRKKQNKSMGGVPTEQDT